MEKKQIIISNIIIILMNFIKTTEIIIIINQKVFQSFLRVMNKIPILIAEINIILKRKQNLITGQIIMRV